MRRQSQEIPAAHRLAFVLIGALLAICAPPGQAQVAFAAPCEDCGPEQPEGGGSGGDGGSSTIVDRITGQFTYAKWVRDEQVEILGIPNTVPVTVPRPIAFAEVEIHRCVPGFLGLCTWGKVLTTTTDSQGKLDAIVAFAKAGTTYGVKVFATNYAAVVWPDDELHIVPFHREPGEPGPIINRTVSGPGQTVDFSFEFSQTWAARHYNLAETVRRGFDYARDNRDPSEADPIPRAPVQPTTSLLGETYYTSPFRTIVIDTSDAFQDFVILHEYGHFLEEHISILGGYASRHNGCSATDSLLGHLHNSGELAWSEGFATYFARAVSRLLPSGTLAGATPAIETVAPCSVIGLTAIDLWGLRTHTITAEMVEDVVSGTLWDLVDGVGLAGTGEAHDQASGGDRAIFEIFDRELGALGRAPTLLDFRLAWAARGLDIAALDRILAFHGVRQAPPASSIIIAPGPDPQVCLAKPWTTGC